MCSGSTESPGGASVRARSTIVFMRGVSACSPVAGSLPGGVIAAIFSRALSIERPNGTSDWRTAGASLRSRPSMTCSVPM